jgi:hypothetical protein
MLINEFQIFNYKSYRETPPIQLSAGFNVFIGKNNSGKTALLEALSLSTLVDRPHRHSGIPRGQPVPPKSRVELTAALTPGDLRLAFLGAGSFAFPVLAEAQQGADAQQGQHLALLHEFLNSPRSFRLIVNAGPSFGASSYPSHGMFTGPSTNRTVEFTLNEEQNDFRVNRILSGDSDSAFVVAGAFVVRSTYTFRAERLSLAAYQYGDRAVLLPNAQNLPEVLNVLQGQHARFEQFNLLVNQVFPSIHRVSVRPRVGNFEIIIWNADAPTDRDDLAIELAESGTGVGQVLAMLYVIVTSESPRTIIIDEPNIFLHPGAIRKLIEIMRADPIGHQYIITTHSPDIIRATDAEHVYLVEREQEQSYIHAANSGGMTGFRRTLLEVGARLSDIFGADNIVWVEGSTEEECFPKIIQARSVERPAGLAVISVRATGDFEGRRASAVAIWEVYHRLSTTGTLMPTTLAISLDKEDRSATDIKRAKEVSGKLMHFLPRRCYENYLIHPSAITAVLNAQPTFLDAPLAQHSVERWLQDHGGDSRYGAEDSWTTDLCNPDWLVGVRGALLLYDLFQGLSDASEEYRKVEHGVAITEWICEHDPEQFTELADYIQDLLR